MVINAKFYVAVKVIAVIVLIVLAFFVGKMCEYIKYLETGYKEGYKEGFKEGYNEGYGVALQKRVRILDGNKKAKND